MSGYALRDDSLLDFQEPTRELIAQAVERAGRDYERWSELVAQCGHCYRPIRLMGRVFQADKATGEIREVYSTEREPDNCIFVPCGNRRATVCPSCSAVYRADTYYLILEGMIGGPVVPASVIAHPMVFVTFTAPSFGAVHAHIRNGHRLEPCRRRSRLGERCPHGTRLGCWERHREDDPRLGTPLCPECFRYEEQVLWNRFAPKLWERTMIYLPRTIARLLGIRMKDLEAVLRKPQFAKVSEYQLRGAIHFHAIFRLDGKGPDGEIVPPPAEFTVELLTEAIRDTARTVEVRPPELTDYMSLRWGKEIYVRPIRRDGPEDLCQEAVAAYVAKYATKGTEGVIVGADRRSAHIRRLMETARELDARPEFGKLRLVEAAPGLGFRGQFSTRSRLYSTTLGAKRRARTEFARRRRLPKGGELLDAWGRPEDEDAVVVEANWRFAGSGYRTKGEEWLALSAAARAREQRRIGREEIRSMTAEARRLTG